MVILDNLAAHGRAAIAGSAGTGKTVLAMEKARRMALTGQRVLLLCFNRSASGGVRHAASVQGPRARRGDPARSALGWHGRQSAAPLRRRVSPQEPAGRGPFDPIAAVMTLPYDMGNAGDLLKHGVLAETAAAAQTPNETRSVRVLF